MERLIGSFIPWSTPAWGLREDENRNKTLSAVLI